MDHCSNSFYFVFYCDFVFAYVFSKEPLLKLKCVLMIWMCIL